MINAAGEQTIVPFKLNKTARIGGNTIDLQLARTVFGDNDAESVILGAITKDNADDVRVYYVNEKNPCQDQDGHT